MKIQRSISLYITVLASSLSAQNFTSDINIIEGSPTIGFIDSDSGADDYWIHAQSNRLYFLWDDDDSGNWSGESPWPLFFEGRDAYFSHDAFVVRGDQKRIGIGTMNPVAEITSVSPASTQISLGSELSNDGMRFEYRGEDQQLRIQGSNIDGAIDSSSITQMTIERSGNIGIGTTSPNAPLEIAGRGDGEELLRFGTDRPWSFKQLGYSGWTALALDSHVGSKWSHIRTNEGNKIASFLSHPDMRVDFLDSKVLFFEVGNDAAFTFDGKVGVGTTNPKEKLQVGNGFAFHDGGNKVIGFQTYYEGGAWKNLSSARPTSVSGDAAGHLVFSTGSGTSVGGASNLTKRMIINNSGNVGIGTLGPSHKLSVNGTIRAKEVIVESGWSDYVFEDDYRLAPLAEVEAHITAHGHLPGIPSATEIEQNGAKLSELVTLQMAKIEELTLHLIEKEKQLSSANERIEEQSAILSSVLTRLAEIESND